MNRRACRVVEVIFLCVLRASAREIIVVANKQVSHEQQPSVNRPQGLRISHSLCDNSRMERLDCALPTPAENVALDEALLEWAEANSDAEFLRIWESPHPIVVAGRSSRIAQEVDSAACAERGIPIIRRSSGGAAIVTGPGCLMYAVVLSYAGRPELKDIGRAHRYVLERLTRTLNSYGLQTVRAGTSDLVIADGGLRMADSQSSDSQSAIRNRSVLPLPLGEGNEASVPRKFSGNSLRAKRTHFLYHGTLLYNFDLGLIATCLRMPSRQPEYRGARSHLDFVANLPLSRQQLIEALDAAWPTTNAATEVPTQCVADLVATRFSQKSWNYEFE